MKFSYLVFIPAAIWFIASSILFFIPGDKLPSEELFQVPNIDKFIHSFLFFVQCYLLYRPYRHKNDHTYKRSMFLRIALAAIVYGLIVELIQKFFILNRSFDLWDLFFDALGCIIAFFFGQRYFNNYRKKIGPDGNRGRNQN